MPHPSHHPTTPRHREAHVHDDQLDEVQQLLALTGGTGLVPPARARAASEEAPMVTDIHGIPRGSRALAYLLPQKGGLWWARLTSMCPPSRPPASH